MPLPSLPDDAELVRRLQARDETAFTQVMDAWSPGLRRLARSFVTTDASAAEVLQDTWMAVVTGVSGFAGRSSLRSWVYRILVNTAKRRGERESRVVPWSSWEPSEGERGPTVDPARFRSAGEEYAGHWQEFPHPWPSPETAAMAEDVRRTVAAAVAKLPTRQRIVVTLRDVEGYPPDEVSVMLEITAANQRVLLHRARAAVRAELEAYFEATGESWNRGGEG